MHVIAKSNRLQQVNLPGSLLWLWHKLSKRAPDCPLIPLGPNIVGEWLATQLRGGQSDMYQQPTAAPVVLTSMHECTKYIWFDDCDLLTNDHKIIFYATYTFPNFVLKSSLKDRLNDAWNRISHTKSLLSILVNFFVLIKGTQDDWWVSTIPENWFVDSIHNQSWHERSEWYFFKDKNVRYSLLTCDRKCERPFLSAFR